MKAYISLSVITCLHDLSFPSKEDPSIAYTLSLNIKRKLLLEKNLSDSRNQADYVAQKYQMTIY